MSRRAPKRPGRGSYRVLDWLAKLGIAGIEPMGLALGLSRSVMYSHVARLETAGLVSRVAAGDGQGGVVVLTRAGARTAEAFGFQRIVAPTAIEASSARHGRAVSWVAASAQRRGLEWLGPAGLRAEPHWRVARDDGAKHAPDLGILNGSARMAVEVELHRKAPARVRTILRGYTRLIDRGQLTAVMYVIGRPEVEALVKREAAAVGLGTRLHIGPLEAAIAATRSRATPPSRDRGPTREAATLDDQMPLF